MRSLIGNAIGFAHAIQYNVTDSHRIEHIVNIDFNSVRYIERRRVARLYYSNI